MKTNCLVLIADRGKRGFMIMSLFVYSIISLFESARRIGVQFFIQQIFFDHVRLFESRKFSVQCLSLNYHDRYQCV